jgi:hypothetical protein
VLFKDTGSQKLTVALIYEDATAAPVPAENPQADEGRFMKNASSASIGSGAPKTLSRANGPFRLG